MASTLDISPDKLARPADPKVRKLPHAAAAWRRDATDEAHDCHVRKPDA